MTHRVLVALSLALGVALVLAQPLAWPVSAHPATRSARAVAAHASGKSSGPSVDLTLHLDYPLTFFENPSFNAFGEPERMGTDVQGDVFVSQESSELVSMFAAGDYFVRNFGSGTQGTGNGSFHRPTGVTATGGVVYVADYYNGLIQTFNQTSTNFISQFGPPHLGNPAGMALGSNGNLYVVDEYNDDVVEFSTSGTYLGSFGGFGTGNGQFVNPRGIAASPYGTLYVTDVTNKNVQEFTLAGSYVTQWGSASFSEPDGIAVDRAGMVYVVDTVAHTVYKFDSGGSLVGWYSAPPTTPTVLGTFVTPVDIVVRSIPNTPFAVFVSDSATNMVQRFDQVLDPQAHTYQAQWGAMGTGNGQFEGPVAAVVDAVGNIYVSDALNNRVQKFDQFGNFLQTIGSSGSGNGEFNFPDGMGIGPDGNLYVVDAGNNRVEVFDTSGNYLNQFGSFGSGDGQFNGPSGVAFGYSIPELHYWDVYVTDSGNNRIEAFGGYPYSYPFGGAFGSQGSGNGQFNDPTGIGWDLSRNELFVADTNNNRIQVYDAGGDLITSLTSAAGGNFNHPLGISADLRGDVYVADTGNNRIVEFDVNTTRSTFFGTAGSGNGQLSNPYGVAVSPTNGQVYVVDTGNSRVERFGSPWLKNDTVGIYRPSTKTFYLRNSNSTGPANIVVPMPYALTGDLPVVGDWNGDGVDTVGLYRPSTGNFFLQDANVRESAPDYAFTLGIPGDTPIAGDWNGDGTDGAGIFRPSNGILYLKNGLSTGYADNTLVLGIPGDKGIAGDWNGDGQDSPGVYRPSNQTFYVSNKVTNGVVYSDATATLGISGDVPFTGDWVFQGSSGIGVFRPSNGITYEKNAISTGFADNLFVYGIAGDIPVAGQWVSPTVTFNKPAPHVSLGTRTGSDATSHPASNGKSAPSHPATTRHTPAATPRRSGRV